MTTIMNDIYTWLAGQAGKFREEILMLPKMARRGFIGLVDHHWGCFRRKAVAAVGIWSTDAHAAGAHGDHTLAE